MMPFPVWLRKRRLDRALHGYPHYNPPHKVEERLLSREKAIDNYDYFMRVRLDRVRHFSGWLRQQFGVKITLDEEGVRELCRWGNKYAGLLLAKGSDGYPTASYFTYDPPWLDENIGNNVVFDVGIMLGEAILSQCPQLRWDVDPISAILPKTGKLLKKTSGMSFQRPLISGFTNPAYSVTPLHQAYTFAFDMMVNTTSIEGIKKFRGQFRFAQRFSFDALLNVFRQTVINYPDGDPAGLMRELGANEALRVFDEEVDWRKSDD